SIVRPLAPATAVGRPLLISLQLAPQIEPLLMTTIVASRANQSRARFVGVPIKPPHHGDRPLHSESENQLHLRPHAANAAVSEFPIKKAARWSADHAGRRSLSELRMVQGIEGFPSKLHPSLLSDQEGLCKGYIKVV